MGEAIGIDQSGGPLHLQAGDAGIDPGIIICIFGALEDPALLDLQVNSLLQENGATDECT